MARDPKRIPIILDILKKAWEKNPDLRLGQLLHNATNVDDMFYYEDDRMLELIETHYLADCDHPEKYKWTKIKVFKDV